MTDAERQEFQETVDRFRTLNTQAENESKSGAVSQETKEAIDASNARLDELELKFKRPQVGNAFEAKAGATTAISRPEVKAAFRNFLTKGRENMNGLEVKLLTVSDDTGGGFLAPEEYVAEIIKDMIEISPIRSLARMRNTSQRSVKMPKRTATPTALWTGEVESATETGSLYGMEEIPNHQLTAMIRVSNEDLEDSAFDLEAELRSDAAEQFAFAEGRAFVLGTGTKQPEGLLTNPDVTFTVSGNASDITADGLINLYYDIKTMYSRNATWLLNRSSLKSIRKLKDTYGQYLWQPNIGLGVMPTILDRAYTEVFDMPDVAPNAFSVIFGDLKKAYMIIDRLDMSVLRDPYSESQNGVVKMVMRRRVGGQVILPQAIRKLKIST